MKKLLAFGMLWISCALAHAQFTFTLQGQVAYIDDGDTLILHPSKESIRLAEIDAPETDHGANRAGQPYGLVARTALAAMMPVGSEITAHCYERDPRNRAVCRVMFNNIDISLEMVRLGHAHAYKEYVRDPRIIGAEQYAKSAQIGLWASGNAVYPQTWRHTCWDASNTPLYCSVTETSADSARPVVVKQPNPTSPSEKPILTAAMLTQASNTLQVALNWLKTVSFP